MYNENFNIYHVDFNNLLARRKITKIKFIDL